MALLNLQPVLDAVGGDAAVSAVFTATVYRAKREAPRIDGATVHFPQKITCNWDGTAWDHTPELDTLPIPYYWHTTVSAGGTRITRDVQLVTPVTTIDYGALPDITPDSGEPDASLVQWQATLGQINQAVLTVTSTQQQIVDLEVTLQGLIAQSNAGVASITSLLAQAQDAAAQAQIDVTAQILSQHAEDITLFEPAGAAAAVSASLAPVATSGAYTDLTGKPTLGTASSHPASDFETAGAAAAVTLSSLGGITSAATDSKISAAITAAAITVLDGNA